MGEDDKPTPSTGDFGPVQAGSLTYRGVVSPHRLNAVGEGFGLIDYRDDLEQLRGRLADLDLGEISELTLAALDRAIGQALGVTPSNRDARDMKASEAWVLVNLAYLDFSLAEAKSRDLTIALAVELGRLLEWWRWRRELHDRKAAGKARSERGLSKARDQLSNDRAFDADWHEEARHRALDLRARNAKWTRNHIAGQLHEEFGVSQRHMDNIIKPVIP